LFYIFIIIISIVVVVVTVIIMMIVSAHKVEMVEHAVCSILSKKSPKTILLFIYMYM